MPRFLFAWMLAAAIAGAGCAENTVVPATDRLKPCTGDDAPTDAYCGSLKVYENRATKQGRQIDLNIVLLPAFSPEPKPDPLVFLAGGPGQGAAKMAKMIKEMYRRVQTDRDIVLVDQRGTGKSNPLECQSDDDSLKAIMEPPEAAVAKLKKCLAGYDADLTQYTTTIAMDDLDDVRAHLGYDKINIYGGSYGTRAGLAYLRQHGDRVRVAILDGVAPPDMRLPLFFPRDAERAFNLLAKDCESDEGCRKVYPNFGERFRALMARLEKEPAAVTVTHPRTGARDVIRADARLVASVIVSVLYSPVASALVPAIVERAEQNDFQGMLALGTLNDAGGEPNMSVGMQLSVICAEDAPRITADDTAKESEGTLFGRHVMQMLRDACTFWPRGAVEPSFYEPVTTNVPTLVMSGELDPITPPVWGEAIIKHLPDSKHIVIPGTGHTAGGTACGLRIIRNFLDKGSFDGLDTSCVANVHRPPFFLTPAGPDPMSSSAKASTSAPATADKPAGQAPK